MQIDTVFCDPTQFFNNRTISLHDYNRAFVLSKCKENLIRLTVYSYYQDTPPNDGFYWMGYKHKNEYNLYLGDKPPKKYAAIIAFLKEEFEKIDWDSYEVLSIVTGSKFQKFKKTAI